MTEAFLHYLWQYRLFNNKNLKSDDGHKIEIVKSGNLNTDAGPDFSNAQIRIDGILWSGNVEIHIHSSDWLRHNHQIDPAYDSCILHVVLENDASTLRMNGTRIPTIELKKRFPITLWDNYIQLIGNSGWIACENEIRKIDSSVISGMFPDLIIEKLKYKSEQILISLNGLKNDWDECFYQYLSRNFGFRINAMPFEMLSRSLPLKIIRKEGDLKYNIEALLFGQAGMLQRIAEDDYTSALQKNYSHLSKKYSLKNIPVSAWKYLRLRPGNFPSIRIAQLSSVLSQNKYLFSSVTIDNSVKEFQDLFIVPVSEYWQSHYNFGKRATHASKMLGKSSAENIIINTCIPFKYAYGKFMGDKKMCGESLNMLSALPPEDNHIISKWKTLGITSNSAMESQSLISLYMKYCMEKKCLSCRIGNKMINTTH